MDVFNINGNRLLLVNNSTVKIIDILKQKSLDSAIIYKHNRDNIFSVRVLEKDGSYSVMCGNGCIALCLKFKRDLVIADCADNKNYVFYRDNVITLQLDIKEIYRNTVNVGGEPHKVYFVENYNRDNHVKTGLQNTPEYNTTFVFYKNNKYYFTTFERGVNGITNACGTGSFAAIHIISGYTKYVYTLDDIPYNFETTMGSYFLKYRY